MAASPRSRLRSSAFSAVAVAETVAAAVRRRPKASLTLGHGACAGATSETDAAFRCPAHRGTAIVLALL